MREALNNAAPRNARRLSRPRTILVIRALQLGDLLCAVPALRALRNAFPEARVTLAGLPWASEFSARFDRYIDDFIEFPGLPGLPERECDVRGVPRFLHEVQSRRFDLALQLHGSGRLFNPLTVLFGARECAGYYAEGAYCPDPDRFFLWREDEHEILRYVRLMRELGIAACDTSLEFPLGDADRDACNGIAVRFGLETGRYVCLHPGSQLPSRRWPAERYAAVADQLTMAGYQIVVTGTAGEAALTRKVTATMQHSAIDLAGATSLGALAALIDGAAALVCNDTGVSHIAAALRTPSVIVCCGSDFRRWAPLDCQRHRVLHHPVDCRPCVYHACPIGHPCATGIASERVATEVGRLLFRDAARNASPACVR